MKLIKRTSSTISGFVLLALTLSLFLTACTQGPKKKETIDDRVVDKPALVIDTPEELFEETRQSVTRMHEALLAEEVRTEHLCFLLGAAQADTENFIAHIQQSETPNELLDEAQVLFERMTSMKGFCGETATEKPVGYRFHPLVKSGDLEGFVARGSDLLIDVRRIEKALQ